jgi:hypothetical protein
MTRTAGCWYAGPAHRPTIGWCPSACNGPVTHSERASNGVKLSYCEAHAYWRRKTIRLPLVRRMRPDEQHPPISGPATAAGGEPRLRHRATDDVGVP